MLKIDTEHSFSVVTNSKRLLKLAAAVNFGTHESCQTTTASLCCRTQGSQFLPLLLQSKKNSSWRNTPLPCFHSSRLLASLIQLVPAVFLSWSLHPSGTPWPPMGDSENSILPAAAFATAKSPPPALDIISHGGVIRSRGSPSKHYLKPRENNQLDIFDGNHVS